METISQQLYTINCFNKSKYIEKFYDLYHKLYLDIWDNYDNLALTMEYYDEFIKSRQESLKIQGNWYRTFIKKQILEEKTRIYQNGSV